MDDDLPNGLIQVDDFLKSQLTKGSTKARIETLRNVQQELSDPGRQLLDYPNATQQSC
jgi:hypothetical protein